VTLLTGGQQAPPSAIDAPANQKGKNRKANKQPAGKL